MIPKLKWTVLLCVSLLAAILTPRVSAQLRVAQLSDLHIGLKEAPDAADKLQRAVAAVNAQSPDVVIVSGDIGESPADWQRAKAILAQLKAPVRYVPGNHDVHTTDLGRYRAAFGDDYYTFDMKGVTFVMIDSQLLGNYDNFEAKSAPALPGETEKDSRKMLKWMNSQRGKLAKSNVVIGVQHIPVYRNGDFPPDPKPYWVINEPYRKKEMDLLKRMGIHHMLVGHWHRGMVFDQDGITWHVAPATSWLPWGGQLGFAMHTISKDGLVTTAFIDLGRGGPVPRTAGRLQRGQKGPETSCAAPPVHAVRICAPADGAQVRSPVHVSAAATGSGIKVIQIYADGEKVFEVEGSSLEHDLPEPAGTHRITVQALDNSGFFKQTVTITVAKSFLREVTHSRRGRITGVELRRCDYRCAGY